MLPHSRGFERCFLRRGAVLDRIPILRIYPDGFVEIGDRLRPRMEPHVHIAPRIESPGEIRFHADGLVEFRQRFIEAVLLSKLPAALVMEFSETASPKQTS